MSCSKTFFNLRIKTLDKKGTSILNKACCGRFEILKTYISRSITHTVHIWKMILRISAYDLKKLMVSYNNTTRNEFTQLYNYKNSIYIEPHNLLFLVATKVSFWFFLSLNINDPHNILFTGFPSLQFAKKCKQNCIKRAFRILWTLSIKLGTWYITLLLLPFLRDLCIRETYDVGRK